MSRLSVVALSFALAAPALAAPGQMPHSGRLLAASGDALEGTHQLEFRIYTDVPNSDPVFTETDTVTVQNGYYSTMLGDNGSVPLTTLDWAGTSYWLAVATSAGEMGRTPLGSVPMALASTGPVRATLLSTAERDQLSAQPGELIFNTDLDTLQVFDGDSWTGVGSGVPVGDGQAKGIGWGLNATGGLGMGDWTQRNYPVAMSSLPTDLIAISSGGYYHGSDGATCAITSSRQLYCSGYESHVPDGQSSNVNTFRQVGPGLQWRSVSMGFGLVSCGVTTDNAAYCWGYQLYGGIGNGVNTGSYIRTATPVIGGISWKELKPGGRYNGAHRAYLCGVSNTVGQANGYCWGLDSYGELGNGTASHNYTDPAAGLIPNIEFETIEPGSYHVCGISTAGDMYCWGYNGYGQLGNGNTTNQQSPVMVPGGYDWVDLDLGDYHTCGLRSDGTAMCWGYNGYGQVGDGTTSNRNRPAEVVGGKTFSEITTGDIHSCGLDPAGIAYCWGYGGQGGRGDGSTSNQPAPTQVYGDYVFETIDAGVRETVGITR